MKFHLETKVGSVKVANGRAIATATKGGEELNFEADKVLVSVGRRAFAEGVGADKIGVALDERGRIKVDEISAPTSPAFTRSATSSPARCWRTKPRRKASPASN